MERLYQKTNLLADSTKNFGDKIDEKTKLYSHTTEAFSPILPTNDARISQEILSNLRQKVKLNWRDLFFGIKVRTLFLFLFLNFSAFALSPEPRLADELDEEKAQKLFLEVRCLVCNGQVIENSNTEFSYEMRQLIRKKISEKKSDEKIKEELVKEFGDDILITPNIKTFKGFLLWLLPLLFGVALAVGFFTLRASPNKN